MKNLNLMLFITFASLNLIAFGADPRSPKGAESTQRELDVESLLTRRDFIAIGGIARLAGERLTEDTFYSLAVAANLNPKLAHLSPDMRLLDTATKYFLEKTRHRENTSPKLS